MRQDFLKSSLSHLIYLLFNYFCFKMISLNKACFINQFTYQQQASDILTH